jgi:hypothetical protein
MTHKTCYSLPLLCPFLQVFTRFPEVLRVCMAVLVVRLTPLFGIPLNRQGTFPVRHNGLFMRAE